MYVCALTSISISYPYLLRFTCPGCRKKCTIDWRGRDIIRGTNILHTTCPVLDADPSNHVLRDDINAAASSVATQPQMDSVVDAIHSMALKARMNAMTSTTHRPSVNTTTHRPIVNTTHIPSDSAVDRPSVNTIHTRSVNTTHIPSAVDRTKRRRDRTNKSTSPKRLSAGNNESRRHTVLPREVHSQREGARVRYRSRKYNYEC